MSKQAEARQRTAREQVKQAQEVARLLIKEVLERNRIDSRYRDERTNTEDDQRANEKQQARL
jgi:hypothetical protein